MINGNSINPSAPVTVNRDGEARFGRIFLQTTMLQIGDLSVFEGTVGISTFGAELTIGNLAMEGGELSLNGNSTAFVVTGSVTATSTTAETARVVDHEWGSRRFQDWSRYEGLHDQ